MGILKHAVPKSAREQFVEAVNARLPDGLLRRQSANLISIAGAGLVYVGSELDGKAGLGLRILGQTFDDIDGDWARAFGVVSDSGALIDPFLDKGKMLLELRTLWRHTADFEPGEQLLRRMALGIIGGKHLVNAGLNTTAQLMGLEPHSSMAGRANLWVDGVAIGAFGVADVTEDPELQRNIANVGYAATAIGMITGGVAIAGYTRQFMTAENTE